MVLLLRFHRAAPALVVFPCQRPQPPIRPIRTLWELDGYSCTTCGDDGNTEWTCLALIEEYNDLAGNPIGTEAYVVEGEGGIGETTTICCVDARFHSPLSRPSLYVDCRRRHRHRAPSDTPRYTAACLSPLCFSLPLSRVPGTACDHLDENIFGTELMTGYISSVSDTKTDRASVN